METHPKHPDVAAIFARLLSELSVSANQLAAQLGTSQQAISNYVTGRNKPGGDLLAAIVTRYPAINSAWLLTGQGEPFPNGRTLAPSPQKAAPAALLPVGVSSLDLANAAGKDPQRFAQYLDTLLNWVADLKEDKQYLLGQIQWLQQELGKSSGSAEATGPFIPSAPRPVWGFQTSQQRAAAAMLTVSFSARHEARPVRV